MLELDFICQQDLVNTAACPSACPSACRPGCFALHAAAGTHFRHFMRKAVGLAGVIYCLNLYASGLPRPFRTVLQGARRQILWPAHALGRRRSLLCTVSAAKLALLQMARCSLSPARCSPPILPAAPLRRVQGSPSTSASACPWMCWRRWLA
jgi:hypothetical protein